MGIEDERRPGAGDDSAREARRGSGRGAREAGLERAVDEVRQVAIEASELLRAEGLKPARLVYSPPGAPSLPLVGRAFSAVRCGTGWHVVRGVVVGTDGRLWARTPAGDPTPQKDMGAWRLEVEAPAGPDELPSPVEFDGTSLHVVRRVSGEEYLKADLIDRLLDGYARLLVLHHRRP